ncbi:MAG TPA: serine/threonine-protein kinase [Acetobacteraceae bacterium]|nr:serine/threonine-protein kinase [Acetobacteraceae bacterium]
MTKPRLRFGSRIGSSLTVLGTLDAGARDRAVYIAWHHGRWCPVACKLFQSDERAREEAALLAAMAHPNIVRFLGLGQPAHLLMEFLEGPTLLGMLRDTSRLGVSDALRVGAHVASALLHMHEQGVLHLDVNPSNIIVSHGRPILFDLGTARRRPDWNSGRLEGTRHYMAPEQCLRQPVAPATDVFGLGVTLYEMLTGKLPFAFGRGTQEYPQITADPVPVRHYRPVPAALDRIIQQCLARDPARRPSLATIIPGLHEFIRSGPPMWPAGFQPNRIPRKEMPNAVIRTDLGPGGHTRSGMGADRERAGADYQ